VNKMNGPRNPLDQASDEERARRGGFTHPSNTPFGAQPVKTASNTPEGDKGYTPIGRNSPAAKAAAAEKQDTKHKPELVAKRAREGK
jgi:hypothetical protein